MFVRGLNFPTVVVVHCIDDDLVQSPAFTTLRCNWKIDENC